LFLSSSTGCNCKTLRPSVRLFTDKSKIQFQEHLSFVDWQSILYDHCDVNLGYNNFVEILLKHYNACFPLTRLSRRASRDKKWITSGLKKSCVTKNRLYEKWLKSRNNDDENKYKVFKNSAYKIVEKSRKRLLL